MKQEKPGYSHPFLHDNNSIQVSDHPYAGVSLISQHLSQSFVLRVLIVIT